ncbi:MAG: OmpA family protein [Pseudomonadota bacterium]
MKLLFSIFIAIFLSCFLFFGCSSHSGSIYPVNEPYYITPCEIDGGYAKTRSYGALLKVLESKGGWLIKSVDNDIVIADVCRGSNCVEVSFEIEKDGAIKINLVDSQNVSSRWRRNLENYITILKERHKEFCRLDIAFLQSVIKKYEDFTLAGRGFDQKSTIDEKDHERTRIIVSRFKNLRGHQEHKWLSIGISYLLSGFLTQINNIAVVERDLLETILKEQALSAQIDYNNKNLPQIGKLVGAEMIITGSYLIDNKEISINTKMFKTETGEIVQADYIRGPVSEIRKLCETVIIKMISKLNYPFSEKEKHLLSDKGQQMVKIMEALSNGELFLADGKFDEARKYYKRALDIEPYNTDILNTIRSIDSRLKSVAIIKFDNIGKESVYDYLSIKIPEDLNTILLQKTALPLTERINLKKALEELKLSQTGLVDEKTAPKIGKLSGASYLITGSFSVKQKNIILYAKLINSETNKILLAESLSGKLENILQTENDIADKLINRLRDVKSIKNMSEKLLAGEKQLQIVLDESSISFDFDSATLNKNSYLVLQDLAKVLLEFPDYRIVVVGHTDNVGEADYNQNLSEMRAHSVLNYLFDCGVEKSRLTSIGYGESKPIVKNSNETNKSRNRRVEFRIIHY